MSCSAGCCSSCVFTHSSCVGHETTQLNNCEIQSDPAAQQTYSLKRNVESSNEGLYSGHIVSSKQLNPVAL